MEEPLWLIINSLPFSISLSHLSFPIELISGTTVMDMPNSTENPVAYIIRPTTNNSMYVLENRQRLLFDSHVPGNGLLIYHIHNSAASGKVDNTRHPQQAYVVSSSITSDLFKIPTAARNSYGSINSSRAPFTNATGRNEFSGNSIPQMFYWTGSTGVPVFDKPITDIMQANRLISFKFRGGSQEVYSPVKNLTVALEENIVRLEWQKPDDDVPYYVYNLYKNGELIQADIKDTFFIDTLTTAGVYDYCVVSSVFGQKVEQLCISLTNISIIEQPRGSDICIGDTFTLTVNALPENLFYQWYKDDEVIEDANENNYIISDFRESDEGIYYVIVSDEAGIYQKQSNFAEVTQADSSICFVGIDKNIPTMTTIQVYPNPVVDNLYINTNSDIFSIIITDLNGREIFVTENIKSSGESYTINTSSWSKAVYIVKIRTKKDQIAYKIVKL